MRPARDKDHHKRRSGKKLEGDEIKKRKRPTKKTSVGKERGREEERTRPTARERGTDLDAKKCPDLKKLSRKGTDFRDKREETSSRERIPEGSVPTLRNLGKELQEPNSAPYSAN